MMRCRMMRTDGSIFGRIDRTGTFVHGFLSVVNGLAALGSLQSPNDVLQVRDGNVFRASVLVLDSINSVGHYTHVSRRQS
jgi:hypothetical protein